MRVITGSALMTVNGFICGYALSAGMFGWATLHAVAAAVCLVATVTGGGE